MHPGPASMVVMGAEICVECGAQFCRVPQYTYLHSRSVSEVLLQSVLLGLLMIIESMFSCLLVPYIAVISRSTAKYCTEDPGHRQMLTVLLFRSTIHSNSTSISSTEKILGIYTHSIDPNGHSILEAKG